jgi:hypothetical protein
MKAIALFIGLFVAILVLHKQIWKIEMILYCRKQQEF